MACHLLSEHLERVSRHGPAGSNGDGPTKPLPSEGRLPLFMVALDNAEPILQDAGSTDSLLAGLRGTLALLAYSSVYFILLSNTPADHICPMKAPLVLGGSRKLARPFTSFGFDGLATCSSAAKSVSLRLATEDEFISHLGRPAFGRLWDAGLRERLLSVAARKLLHSDRLDGAWSDEQVFACLSQRLSLRLLSGTPSEGLAERRQIQNHLRICLTLDSSSGQMTSMSPSEPLLAEAAYWAMHTCSLDVPCALQTVCKTFEVRVGRRGDLFMRALLTVARDGAVGEPNVDGHPQARADGESGRLVTSVAFFRHLLKPLDRALRGDRESDPFLDEHQIDIVNQFGNDFQNCNMHFNHFVSVQPDSLRMENFLVLLARGAAVQCADYNYDIDAVLFMVDGLDAALENLHIILVKTTKRTNQLDKVMACMNPYSMEIWSAEYLPSKPLVRVLFAPFVENETAYLSINKHSMTTPGPLGHCSPYDCYDIVIAGVSSSILGALKAQNEDSWRELLRITPRHARFAGPESPDPFNFAMSSVESCG